MDQSATRYQFLEFDLETQLFTLFRNYLSLGQFELARATFLQLYSIAPEKANDLIKQLITTADPPEFWYSIVVCFLI
jgi:hypothetical protein